MSIFNAMITSVGGLRAQAFALENISSNIANSQTIGYKRVDTSFMDLVPEMPLNSQLGGSVMGRSRATNTMAGSLTATGVPTHAALDGGGFFMVRERNFSSMGVPSFNATNIYTRRGDFELDRDGYLVNGAEGFLLGYPVDPLTGAQTSGTPAPVQLDSRSVQPAATTTIEYRGNLPSMPATSKADKTIPGSELLTAAGLASDPNTATGTVTAADEATFLAKTISGGSITVYDGLGNPSTVQFRWGKSASASGSGPDTWQLFYMSDANASGSGVKWKNAGTPFTFGSNTTMTSPTGAITIPGMTVGGHDFGAIKMQPVLTQAAAASGQVQTTVLRQDGYAAGELTGVSFTSDGRIVASYTNGNTRAVSQIGVAHFNGVNLLKRRGGGGFEETIESGAPIVGMNDSLLQAGMVEGSNTDIAEEFSKMIVTQQAYSANTRVVTTAQQMLQDTINIIR